MALWVYRVFLTYEYIYIKNHLLIVILLELSKKYKLLKLTIFLWVCVFATQLKLTHLFIIQMFFQFYNIVEIIPFRPSTKLVPLIIIWYTILFVRNLNVPLKSVEHKTVVSR